MDGLTGKYSNRLRIKIITSPINELNYNQKLLRDFYDKNARTNLYSCRNLVDGVGRCSVGVSINLEHSINDLLGFYLMKGDISHEEAQKVIETEERFGLMPAIDFFDCEIMQTRKKGSLYFDNQLH